MVQHEFYPKHLREFLFLNTSLLSHLAKESTDSICSFIFCETGFLVLVFTQSKNWLDIKDDIKVINSKTMG